MQYFDVNTWVFLTKFNHADLQTGFLSLSSGVIWNALNIDYPGHSFSHLGAFHGKCHLSVFRPMF